MALCVRVGGPQPDLRAAIAPTTNVPITAAAPTVATTAFAPTAPNPGPRWRAGHATDERPWRAPPLVEGGRRRNEKGRREILRYALLPLVTRHFPPLISHTPILFAISSPPFPLSPLQTGTNGKVSALIWRSLSTLTARARARVPQPSPPTRTAVVSAPSW